MVKQNFSKKKNENVSADVSFKADYKDVKFLSRFISEKGTKSGRRHLLFGNSP